MPFHSIRFRDEVVIKDPARIRELIIRTGFFTPAETDIAEELVQTRLEIGDKSGYFFILAEKGELLAGYTCFGPIPLTEMSHDLYWIAVHPDFQGEGLGRKLMEKSEKRIREAGGTRIYVETSSRDQYAGTRAFYETLGYRQEAVISDFYRPGDSKVIYCKVVG
ncbi:MAG: GNAT family N-acetyltransferase [Pseudomonadota bacterium]